MPNAIEQAGGNSQLTIDFYHIPSDDTVTFPAIMTDFTDGFESKWNEEEVYGRNDPLLTFEGTSREISFSFMVVAHSADEARTNLEKLQTLIYFHYPHYNEGGKKSVSTTTLSAAPLMKIRLLNWMVDVSKVTGETNIGGGHGSAKNTGLVGKSGGIETSPNLDIGTIFDEQVTLGQAADASGRAYPKEFEISMDFLVNHMHQLGWNSTGPRQKEFPYALQNNVITERDPEKKEKADKTPEETDADRSETGGGNAPGHKTMS